MGRAWPMFWTFYVQCPLGRRSLEKFLRKKKKCKQKEVGMFYRKWLGKNIFNT
jgi:hypothetical protein